MEQGVARLGRGGGVRCGRDLLLDGISLAGQQRLVHLRAIDGEDDAVGRHEVSGGEEHDVARHDVGHGQGDARAVAQNAGAERDRPLERFRRGLGAMLLDHVERGRKDHHEDDDREARHVPGHAGDGGGGQQDRHERIGQPAQQVEQYPPLRASGDFVGSVASEPGRGLGAAKALPRRAKPGEHLVGRVLPERRLTAHGRWSVGAAGDGCNPFERAGDGLPCAQVSGRALFQLSA